MGNTAGRGVEEGEMRGHFLVDRQYNIRSEKAEEFAAFDWHHRTPFGL